MTRRLCNGERGAPDWTRMSRLSLLLLVLAAHAAAAAPLAREVECVAMTVSDADRAADFYSRVLSFEKTGDAEEAGSAVERREAVFGARLRTVRLRLGAECLELMEVVAPRGRPVPADSRSNDRWFQHVAIVVSDMDRAYASLRAARVEHASSGPQRLPEWNLNAGGIRAFYFRDPDRHVLEVIQFPAGKGDSRWHRAGRLFLGIDHTAIVVADTDASLRFWRDALGLRVAGESENWGTEQEHLNAVFGAHLRITTLRAERGPGVELLEYLSPRDGRPYPADARANDLLHWQTRLRTLDLAAAARALRRPASTSAFLARDPDGHAVEIAE